jgi:metallo-beta-lactamase family protein
VNVTFHGAARSVTGSRHLVNGAEANVLLDCGMFQGRREEADRRNRDLGFDPRSIHAVLLSHAHIDHSGALPILTKHGFRGDVHMTKATADLAAVMLEDSARVQEADCAYVNKKEGRWGEASVKPFYDGEDTRAIVRRFIGSGYDRTIRIAPTLTASFHEAGHIFGSAAVRLKYSAQGRTRTILFSGDLGRARMPVIKDPAVPPPCVC